jgi:uncharacterized protein YrzB (UPF0473 family)
MLGIALLTLAGAATFAPVAMAAHPNAGVPHGAKSSGGSRQSSTVSGKLQSYTAGVGATVIVSAGARHAASHVKAFHVSLSFHTRVDYAGKNHAAPFPTKGDKVVVTVNWNKNTAHASTMTYNDQSNPPSGGESEGEDGTSRFRGAYDLAASSSTVLALTEENGTVDQFSLSANTVYFENGQQVTSPTLTDGERLGVEATQQPDGSWAANTVIIGDHHGDHGGDGQGEDFRGQYASSTSTTLTVADEDGTAQTFTVDANTMYFDMSGNQVPSLTYTAGEALHVEATQQSDGTWLATVVSAKAGHGDHGAGEDHAFRGTYASSPDATHIVITDQDGNSDAFTVDSNTKYFDQNGNPVPSLTYTVGEPLRVRATRQSDGTWLATEVSTKASDEHGGGGAESQHFRGAYASSPDATHIVITDEHGNSAAFTVDANTQYFDQNGNSVTSLTYTVGETLRVEATQQSDGTWLATVVSAFNGQHEGGEAEDFHGAYASSPDATHIVITDEDGNSDTFTVDSKTQYFDQNGNPVLSLTYTASEPLRVEATQQSDGSWLATVVSASSGDDHGGD